MISQKLTESVLANKELNQIKFSYEREKATIIQKRKPIQWYDDYINDLELLEIINIYYIITNNTFYGTSCCTCRTHQMSDRTFALSAYKVTI